MDICPKRIKTREHIKFIANQAYVVDDPNALLAAEIVIAAIEDWRYLTKKKQWDEIPSCYCNFEELRIFFKSDWCGFLMQNFDIAPERILEILERELREAKAQDEQKKKRKGKRK